MGRKDTLNTRPPFWAAELVELWRYFRAADDRPVGTSVALSGAILSPKERSSGYFPGTAAENHGVDVADHTPLHDLVLIDREMRDTGTIRHIHGLE